MKLKNFNKMSILDFDTFENEHNVTPDDMRIRHTKIQYTDPL